MEEYTSAFASLLRGSYPAKDRGPKRRYGSRGALVLLQRQLGSTVAKANFSAHEGNACG